MVDPGDLVQRRLMVRGDRYEIMRSICMVIRVLEGSRSTCAQASTPTEARTTYYRFIMVGTSTGAD